LRVLNRAEQVAAATRSYVFAADTTFVAASRLQTHIVGRVVRGQGLAYSLTVRSKRTQVVRLRSITYVRVVPHRWSRLKPHSIVNPTTTLLAVLRALSPTDVTDGGHGKRVVHGTLDAAAAQAVGLPKGAQKVTVTVIVDRTGHVIALVMNTTVPVSSRVLKVDVRTSYGAFGHVAPIRKPV